MNLHHKHEVVQLPNLSDSNRYRPSGLSFLFVSEKVIPLGGYVSAGGLAFSVRNVEMAYEDCEWGDALLYTCTKSGSSVRDDFDLRSLNGNKVILITDPEEIRNIRKVAGYC